METVSYDGSFRRKHRVILSNDKHGTFIALMTHPYVPLTSNQQRRSRQQLCGIEGCECNKDLGTHGPQAYYILYTPGEGFYISTNQLNFFTTYTRKKKEKIL